MAEDPIEQMVAAGGSGLTYDPATATYTYVWKTKLGTRAALPDRFFTPQRH